MPLDMRLFRSGVSDMKSLFDKKAEDHKQSQMQNPFSEWQGAGCTRRLSREDVGYGRPAPGSQSEKRSLAGHHHVMMEVKYLCDMIWDCAEWRCPDGRAAITFGKLFKLYITISDKVVGTLLRARKYKFVYFEGEMLYQRRDDDRVIELTRPINTIRARFGQRPLVTGGGDVEPWGAGGEEEEDIFSGASSSRRNSTPGGGRRDNQASLPTERRHSLPHTLRSADTAMLKPLIHISKCKETDEESEKIPGDVSNVCKEEEDANPEEEQEKKRKMMSSKKIFLSGPDKKDHTRGHYPPPVSSSSGMMNTIMEDTAPQRDDNITCS